MKESKRLSEFTRLLSSGGVRAQLRREAPEVELSFATTPLEIKIKLKHVAAGFAAAAFGFLSFWRCKFREAWETELTSSWHKADVLSGAELSIGSGVWAGDALPGYLRGTFEMSTWGPPMCWVYQHGQSYGTRPAEEIRGWITT